jgi:MFS family permease
MNANEAIVATIVGELSNAENQGVAFSYLPIFSGAGEVIGTVIGGALVFPADKYPSLFGHSEFLKTFPWVSLSCSLLIASFFLPNALCVLFFTLQFTLVASYLKESYRGAAAAPPKFIIFLKVWDRLIQFVRNIIYRNHPSPSGAEAIEAQETEPLLETTANIPPSARTEFITVPVFSRNVLIVIGREAREPKQWNQGLSGLV